jgi:hypothetical protein
MVSERKRQKRDSNTPQTPAVPVETPSVPQEIDQSKRNFVRMIGSGLAGLIVGGLAVKTYDMSSAPPVSNPNVVPCKNPPAEIKRLIIENDRNALQEKLGIFSAAAQSLFDASQDIFCKTCDTPEQRCDVFELLVNGEDVSDYRSFEERLSSGQLAEYVAKLKAFSDANSVLIGINQDELELLQKVLTKDSQTIATWNNSHRANKTNDYCGYGTRQWQLMNRSQACLTGAVLTDGAFSEKTLTDLQDAIRMYKLQGGFLSRNSGFAYVANKAVATIENGVTKLKKDFETYAGRRLWDRDGIQELYEGVRQFFLVDPHVEEGKMAACWLQAPIEGLCDYLLEELRVNCEDFEKPNDPTYLWNDPRYDALTQNGRYDIPRPLLDRLLVLADKLDDKKSYFINALQSASAEQMFRIVHAVKYSLDPETKQDFIKEQANTLYREVGIESADVDTIIRAMNFRRAAFDHGTATDAWHPLVNYLVEDVDPRKMGQLNAEEEIAKRLMSKYALKLFGPEQQVCILERIRETALLGTGGKISASVLLQNALHRAGIKSETFSLFVSNGYHTSTVTYENGQRARVWDYPPKINKLVYIPFPDFNSSNAPFVALQPYFKSSINPDL